MIDINKLKKPDKIITSFWLDAENYKKLKLKLEKKKVSLTDYFNAVIKSEIEK